MKPLFVQTRGDKAGGVAGDRETDTQSETDTERDREMDTQRDMERQTETERQTKHDSDPLARLPHFSQWPVLGRVSLPTE